MTSAATDNFNRADENPMTNWLDMASPNTRFKVVSNSSTTNDILSVACSVYDGGKRWPNDQYSQGKVTVTGTNAQSGFGVCVRASIIDVASKQNMYWAVVNKAVSNNIYIAKWVNGAEVSIGFRTSTWVDGDVLKLEAIGIIQPTLRVYQNGSQLGADFTDNNGPSYPQGGRPGLLYLTTATSGSIDDWEGGGDPDGIIESLSDFPKFKMRPPRPYGV